MPDEDEYGYGGPRHGPPPGQAPDQMLDEDEYGYDPDRDGPPPRGIDGYTRMWIEDERRRATGNSDSYWGCAAVAVIVLIVIAILSYLRIFPQPREVLDNIVKWVCCYGVPLTIILILGISYVWTWIENRKK